jgi:hypothetical protein
VQRRVRQFCTHGRIEVDGVWGVVDCEHCDQTGYRRRCRSRELLEEVIRSTGEQ